MAPGEAPSTRISRCTDIQAVLIEEIGQIQPRATQGTASSSLPNAALVSCLPRALGSQVSRASRTLRRASTTIRGQAVWATLALWRPYRWLVFLRSTHFVCITTVEPILDPSTTQHPHPYSPPFCSFLEARHYARQLARPTGQCQRLR